MVMVMGWDEAVIATMGGVAGAESALGVIAMNCNALDRDCAEWKID
jgi:hypothetical protein